MLLITIKEFKIAFKHWFLVFVFDSFIVFLYASVLINEIKLANRHFASRSVSCQQLIVVDVSIIWKISVLTEPAVASYVQSIFGCRWYFVSSTHICLRLLKSVTKIKMETAKNNKGKRKVLTQRQVCSRMNFLYQAANLMAHSNNNTLAAYYGKLCRHVGTKSLMHM